MIKNKKKSKPARRSYLAEDNMGGISLRLFGDNS